MTGNVRTKWLIAILLLAVAATTAQAEMIIDMVPVGNLGNTADTTGYGAVDYAYNIGKYEVTAGQYTEFLNAKATTDTYGLYNTEMWSSGYGAKIERSGSSGIYSYSVAADWANRPVNFVSFWDAARFANWLHNGQADGDTESGAYHDVGNQSLFGRNPGATFFIPTEDEWYKAAYHKNDGDTGEYFVYPTSSDLGPSNALDLGGNNATYDNSGYTIGSPYYRTEVGAHENSESPYGTFDQGGNVWEWNEAIISGLYRGLRGGSFIYNQSYLRASYRGYDPSFQGDFGFRVASSAAVPEPGSMVLWAGLGLMGLIWWRRRR